MARPKKPETKKAEAENEALIALRLPEYLENAPLLKRTGVRRGKLSKYLEQMLLLMTPELTGLFFRQLRVGVRDGDRESMRMLAEMFGYVKRSQGVNIVTTIQQNSIAAMPLTTFSMDRIVRELEAGRTTIDLPPQEKSA
jgi:hypothetical protein